MQESYWRRYSCEAYRSSINALLSAELKRTHSADCEETEAVDLMAAETNPVHLSLTKQGVIGQSDHMSRWRYFIYYIFYQKAFSDENKVVVV